jgi:deoxyribose-phosphate aldolase
MGSRTVAVAADHGGYPLKQALAAHLRSAGYAVLDCGTHSTDACDYPVFAQAAAEAVANGQAWRGIVIDGAGIGSCMVANKVPGVRAGMAVDPRTATNARAHNNANVLSLGAGYLSEEQARAIVDVFLTTDCSVDRHLRRASMIDALDGTRNSASTSMAAPDHARLVEAITKVLTSNPALLSGFVGGAPGQVCTTCNPCTRHCAATAPDKVRAMLPNVDGRVSSRPGIGSVPVDVAGMIDHTLLKPEATPQDIDKLCQEAIRCGFKSVCVNPIYVARAAKALRGSKPVVCTVIGFPLGATTTQTKVLEARRALRDGAKELDMVIAIGLLKAGEHDAVYKDIRALAETARESGALLKVIIETALLTDEEKIAACVAAKKARAHFVKTSTGFAKGGATAADVALMAEAVDYKLEVKASGGVRSGADAQKMFAAGATRIGASVGVKIAGCEVPGGAAGSDAY